MRTEPFLFIDIETTGLYPDTHEIIEIGCLLVENAVGFPVLRALEMKVLPTHIATADPRALRVNGYDATKWHDALPLHEALQKLTLFSAGAIPVGHNVSFDTLFLEKAYRDMGAPVPFHYHKLDTMSIAYAKIGHYDDMRQYSLRALTKRFDIQHDNAHTALSDATATYELFKKLMAL